MSNRINIVGKSLKGYASGSSNMDDGNATGNIIGGNVSGANLTTVDLENVSIFSGTADDLTIGKTISAPAWFKELTVGKQGGPSGPVTFWGSSTADSVKWDPDLAIFTINGKLSVRDSATIGNLRIRENRLEAILPTPDGNVILGPLGAGVVGLGGPLTQVTDSYIALDRCSTASISGTANVNIDGGTSMRVGVRNGDASIVTDYPTPSNPLLGYGDGLFSVMATSPTTLLVTTKEPHGLKTGDIIDIVGTSVIYALFTVETIDGRYTIFNVTETTFEINHAGMSLPVGLPWNASQLLNAKIQRERTGKIKLDAGTLIECNRNVPLRFGDNDRSQLVSTSEANLAINTDFLTIDDPIPLLRTPSSLYSDSGIQVSYRDQFGSLKTGFFGLVNNLNSFTWIPSATIVRNSNGTKTVSGDRGSMALSNLTVNQLNGDPDLFLTAVRDIIFTAGRAIRFPNSIPLHLGTNSTLTPFANGNVVLASAGDLQVSPSASGRGIVMSVGSPITFNGSGGGQQIFGNAQGLFIASNTSVRFSVPTSGNIFVPANVPLAFGIPGGGSTATLSGTSTGLAVASPTAIALNAATAVTVPLNIPVQLGATSNSLIGNNGGVQLGSTTGNATLLSTNGIIQLNAPAITTTSSSMTTPSAFTMNFGTTNSISTTSATGVTIGGSNSIVLNAPNAINLNSAIVNVPLNVPLTFGSRGQIIQVPGNMNISTAVGDSLNITSGNVMVNGNLTVTGQTTYVNTINSSFRDTLLELSRGVPIGDITDKGFIFNWWDGTTDKLGAVYWDLSEKRFRLAANVSNNNEILTATELANLELSGLIANNISTSSFTVSTIIGNPDLRLIAPGSIFLDATNSVVLPSGVPLRSGNNQIVGTASGWNITGNNVVITNGQFQVGNVTMNMTDLNNFSISGVSNIRLDGTVFVERTIRFGTGQSQISVDNNDVLTLTSPSRILATSTMVMQSGYIIGNASMTFSNAFPGGRLILQNTTPTAPLDVSIRGTIYDATWAGNPIGLDYGGTGHVGAWSTGSVVFVETNNTGSFLSENNPNFFWDNSLLTLGLRASNPSETLTIGTGNIEFRTHGRLLWRHSGLPAWTFGKSTSGNLLTLYTSPGTVTQYSSLTSMTFGINQFGTIGVGVSETQMLGLTGASSEPRLWISGNILFANQANRIGWSASQYLVGDNLNGVTCVGSQYTFTGSTIHRVDAQFLESTQRIYGTIGGRLHIASTTGTYFRSPHNVFVGRCCFVHDPVTDTCNGYIENGSKWVLTDGNISLEPLASVTIVGDRQLLFGDAGSIGATLGFGGSGDLHISSTNNLLLEPLNGSVQINNDKSLEFNNGALSMNYDSTAGVFEIASPTSGVVMNTTNLRIPDNVPLIFGTTSNERTIISDGRNLIVTAGDRLKLDTNLVQITGNLVVDGTTIQRIFSETMFDAGILKLGGGSITKIVGMSEWSATSTVITTSATHYLVAGDSIMITNSDPDIDGNYNVLQVPTATTFVISKVPPVVQAGEVITGDVQSALVMNPNVDLGIQLNWHTGQVGTIGARYSFFGVDRATNRFTYLVNGNQSAGNFAGTLGEAEFATTYMQNLSAANLISPMNTGANAVTGSNFRINGGAINSTPIGNLTPSTGVFTNLRVTGTLTIDSTNTVTNLNADLLDGMHANEFVYRNGTLPMTADWQAGPFMITSGDLASLSLLSGSVVYAGASGKLLTSSGFTFNGTTLGVPSISGFTLAGRIVGAGNEITNVALTSSTITSSSMTLGASNTLDVSTGTVIFRTGQIHGSWLAGGTGAINISGNSATVTNGVYTTNYGAHTILKADTPGAPVALTVREDRLVGRKAGGVITDLTPLEVRTMLNVSERGAESAYESGALLRAGHLAFPDAGTMTGLFFYSTERIIMQADSAPVTMSADKQLTYITVTFGASTTLATVILPDGYADGQVKMIIVSNIPNGVQLKIQCAIALPNASGPAITGLLANKARQSTQLVWDNTLKEWFVMATGMLPTSL